MISSLLLVSGRIVVMVLYWVLLTGAVAVGVSVGLELFRRGIWKSETK